MSAEESRGRRGGAGGRPARSRGNPQRLVLVLYVSGQASASIAAITRLQRILRACGPDDCELRILDVRKDPSLVASRKLLATPALDKLAPPPAVRILGDLNDEAQVARLLGLLLPEEGRGGARKPPEGGGLD